MPVSLLSLARDRFNSRPLTDGEIALFAGAESGKTASGTTGDKQKDHRRQAKHWPANRVINAECIEWICTKNEASALITHRGLDLDGMRIDGDLDLDFAQIAFPIRATNCVFNGQIILDRARLKSFALSNCAIKGLQAGGVHIEGELELNEGFRCRGEINLIGAVIDGALDLHGAILNNPKGYSLTANRAKIGASVFARKGFRSCGEIDLTKVNIGGNLDCTKARLKNPKGESLSASSAVVSGNIFLRWTRSTGQINLKFTTVGGLVACNGASLIKPDGEALLANALRVTGSVSLIEKFTAIGELVFRRAKIEGDLEILDARLEPALVSENPATETTPSVTTQIQANQSKPNPELKVPRSLNLEQASVLAYRDDPGSRPPAESLLLDGFTYQRIFTDKAPLSAQDRLEWVNRQRSNVFAPQPYEQLASIFRKMGHEGQSRKVLIEKNKAYARFLRRHFKRQSGKPFRRLARFRSKEWWWYNSIGNLIGYGYKPWRAFGLSVLVILFGTFLLHEGYKHGLILPTHKEAYEKVAAGVADVPSNRRLSPDYPRFNSFAYSIESFIPLLKFDQVNNWAPNGNQGDKSFMSTKAGSLLWGYLCLQVVLGWILTSLWVGALTGLLKT